MKLREAYEYALVECNKVKAPAIMLDDFIYLFNKAIQQYVNSVYNRCEYNQQASDDLKWCTVVKDLLVKQSETNKANDKIYICSLPEDYLHILNCIVTFSRDTGEYSKYCPNKKTDAGQFAVLCSRLTADLYPGILNNYYMKPSEKRPYYEIDKDNNIKIHVGDSRYEVVSVMITYLKTPTKVSMTLDDVYAIDDNTPDLEFPDYVCYEIINWCVKLLLENAGDPRLITNIPVNNSIAVPGN